MARERLLGREKDRKKELELSRFSHGLSHVILTENGKAPLGNSLPDTYVTSFQKGSRVDRSAYWQEQAGQANFGVQIMQWVGAGDQPGMAQWLERQNDPDVVGILNEVGLKGSPENLQAELKGERVSNLIAVVNADLQKDGKQEISEETLSRPDAENYARSLIFYANYLNPAEGSTADTKSLIDTLVVAAQKEGGTVDETIARLQKVAPLLQVAGQEGQHVLAALMVAKTHLQDEREKVQQAGQSPTLFNDDEKDILSFLDIGLDEREEQELPELEPATPYVVADVLEDIMPEATPGHPYWVDKDIPADFAATLSREQLASLEQKKPLYILNKDTKEMDVNPEAFDPMYELQQNDRRINVLDTTYYRSQLLALSAASAATPEQQATLFKALGDTVLRAHVSNPELLDTFLHVQTQESLDEFGYIDFSLTRPMAGQNYQQLETDLIGKFEEKFGKQLNINTKITPEEQDFLNNGSDEVLTKQREFETNLLREFAADQDRSVAVEIVETEGENLLQQVSYHVNIPETVKIWPERIVALQDALSKEPLTLTLEQLGQIDFLSRSVNMQKTMALLRGESVAQQVEREPEQPKETLTTLFTTLANVESNFPGSLEKRRQDVAIRPDAKLQEFSTDNEDVDAFEIVNEDKSLAILTPDKKYNTRNPFLAVLTKENTLSDFILTELQKRDFGPNTLMAYAFEAVHTPEEQNALVKSLFSQVVRIYTEHPEVGQHMKEYNTSLTGDSAAPIIERLFGTPQETSTYLAVLMQKVQENTEMTPEEIYHMGAYALPFNIQYLAQRMQLKAQDMR